MCVAGARYGTVDPSRSYVCIGARAVRYAVAAAAARARRRRRGQPPRVNDESLLRRISMTLVAALAVAQQHDERCLLDAAAAFQPDDGAVVCGLTAAAVAAAAVVLLGTCCWWQGLSRLPLATQPQQFRGGRGVSKPVLTDAASTGTLAPVEAVTVGAAKEESELAQIARREWVVPPRGWLGPLEAAQLRLLLACGFVQHASNFDAVGVDVLELIASWLCGRVDVPVRYTKHSSHLHGPCSCVVVPPMSRRPSLLPRMVACTSVTLSVMVCCMQYNIRADGRRRRPSKRVKRDFMTVLFQGDII
eukprot:SAG25_NODE_1586_length_2725_cov_2.005706_3_plen_304_part_00